MRIPNLYYKYNNFFSRTQIFRILFLDIRLHTGMVVPFDFKIPQSREHILLCWHKKTPTEAEVCIL